MATYHLNQAKANLSSLVAAAGKGEDVVITRYGKPVARLCAIGNSNSKAKSGKPAKRVLGFYPMDFKADLLAPTDDDIIAEFYRNEPED